MKSLLKSLFSGSARVRASGTKHLDLVITERQQLAQGILAFRLEAASGEDLPAFSAGAHIDVTLDNGLVRQYSLCCDPSDLSHYRIAVLREEGSRGGSERIHATWRAGMKIRASMPRNNFTLPTQRARFHLIAGGIGITPFWSIIRELLQRGDDFKLYYCARTPERAAFVEDLQALLGRDRLAIHYSRVGEPRRLDVSGLLAGIPKSDYVYCCGPNTLIETVQAACRDRADRLRFEHFAPPAPIDVGSEPFEVFLARSGDCFTVPTDSSLLETLLSRGHHVESSCQEGICGSCPVRHLEGEIVHRDYVLSATEKSVLMAPCVSRGRGRVVLDL